MLLTSSIFHLSKLERNGPQDPKLMGTYKLTPEQMNQIKQIRNQNMYTEWLAQWTAKGQINPVLDRAKLQEALASFDQITKLADFKGDKKLFSYSPTKLYDVIRYFKTSSRNYTNELERASSHSSTFDEFINNLKQENLPEEFHNILMTSGGYSQLRHLWDKLEHASDEDSANSLDHLRISPRNPLSEKATEDPHAEERLQPGLKGMSQKSLHHNVALLSNYPQFRNLKSKSPEGKALQMVTLMKDNLVWLYQQWEQHNPDTHQRSKKWYVGGNRLMHRWANKFEVSPLVVAGVTAALSPQKDWYVNVSLTERILVSVLEHADFKWDSAMTEVVLGWTDKKEENAEDSEDESEDTKIPKPKPKDLLRENLLQGKSLNDFRKEGNIYLEAVWVRAFDEAHHPRQTRTVSPEGEFGDWKRTKDGTTGGVPWQSFAPIIKALKLLQAKTPRDISDIVGKNHKVRSFYNNLVSPMSSGGKQGGDVTIDTHAVAAALLKPLAGSSKEVSHNFGSSWKPSSSQLEKMTKAGVTFVPEGGPSSSKVTGSTGTYGFYADAYRLAAKELGVSPRELQSITWEAVRSLFKPEDKRDDKIKDGAAQLWDAYAKKKLSLDDVRQKLVESSEGFEDPSWTDHHYDGSEVNRDSSFK